LKTVLQNLASVVGGEAAVRAANFVVVLFISREYGAAALGAYAVSLAVSTVVVMFADIPAAAAKPSLSLPLQKRCCSSLRQRFWPQSL
jgi:O-antigen/teichoic acid export membrane protein